MRLLRERVAPRNRGLRDVRCRQRESQLELPGRVLRGDQFRWRRANKSLRPLSSCRTLSPRLLQSPPRGRWNGSRPESRNRIRNRQQEHRVHQPSLETGLRGLRWAAIRQLASRSRVNQNQELARPEIRVQGDLQVPLRVHHKQPRRASLVVRARGECPVLPLQTQGEHRSPGLRRGRNRPARRAGSRVVRRGRVPHHPRVLCRLRPNDSSRRPEPYAKRLRNGRRKVRTARRKRARQMVRPVARRRGDSVVLAEEVVIMAKGTLGRRPRWMRRTSLV
jgi:hypothetical protein